MNDHIRQKLLDACELLEAIRPFADPGNASRKPFNDAWDVAFQQAKELATQYVAAMKGSGS